MLRGHLPPEIIEDILSREPVKSLLRFRCVSKPWCVLIDASDFIKLHLNKSISNTSAHSLIACTVSKLYFLEFESLNCVRKIDIEFLNRSSHWIRLLGNCNGLLLLQHYYTKFLCLVNPLTRKIFYLPDDTTFNDPSKYAQGFSHVLYGLGYIPQNDDYKVVKVVEFHKKHSQERIGSETWVYSLKLNSWKRVRDFPYSVPNELRVLGAQVNGVFHSSVKQTCENRVRNIILGFDIGSETFNTTDPPDYWNEFNTGDSPEFWDVNSWLITMEALDGCLCLLATYIWPPRTMDIWLMKEYGVRNSWVKLLSIAPPIVDMHIFAYPVAYSKNRDEVLLNYDEHNLVWYRLDGKTVRNVKARCLPHTFYAEVCVGSLVPLPTNQDEQAFEVKKQNVEEKPKKKKRDDFLSTVFNCLGL